MPKGRKEKILKISRDEIGKLYLMLCDKNLADIKVRKIRPLLEGISESIADRISELFKH